MMKSEYDRCYKWNPPGGNYYSQHLRGKKNVSEPLMTHKRRVKLTEDNVIIGEPLPSQNDDYVKEDPYFVLGDKNKKFHPSVPYRNMKAFDKPTIADKRDNKPKQKHKRNIDLINEAVQTDIDFAKAKSERRESGERGVRGERGEKSTQISMNVPPSLEQKPPKDSAKLVRPGERSEYQTKFAWVDPVERQSLAIDKGAHNRSKIDTQLKIYSNFVSEYQRQFRPYEFVSEHRFKRMKPSLNRSYDESHLQFVPPHSAEMRPRRAITPPPPPPPPPAPARRALESGSSPSPARSPHRSSHRSPQRRRTPPQHTINPHRFRFPHGRHKRFLTEYAANFDNKWQKLEAEFDKNLQEEAARKSLQQSKWYKEILELRKKAQEYRQRARGTHFSREHLGEIFTKTRRPDIDDCDDSVDRRAIQSARMNRTTDKVDDRDRGRDRHRHNRHQRASSVEETIQSPNSRYSSDESTVVAPAPAADDKKTRPSANEYRHTAGKPSFDNSLLLDEEASHDTELKDESALGGFRHGQRYRPVQPHMAKTYTLQRYFNDNDNDGKLMATIDYDTIGRRAHSSAGNGSSIISSATSCHTAASTATSRSLALDTLERAKRHRDDILRSKS